MIAAEVADLAQVAEAFWRGSFGNAHAFLSGTLVRAIPLTLIGVGVSLAFRAGVFNIGGEGQFLLGAVAATVAGLAIPGAGALSIVAGLAAAAAGGAIWASVAALLRARFGVLEVISTIMLNFVALNLVSYLVRGPLQEPTRVYPQTDPIAVAARLPRLWETTRLHAGLFLALGAAAITWWLLTRSAAGFRLRVAGASPTAAAVSGRIDVGRVTIGAFAASGALAGLAGGVEVSGVTYVLYENLSPGYGFSAIAVAILARLRPEWVPLSAVFFAGLEAGALGMQRDAGIPSVVALALEAAVILLVVALGGVTRLASWRDHAALRRAPGVAA